MLQDLSQPNSETDLPDGVLAVPLLKHQVLSSLLGFLALPVTDIFNLYSFVKNRVLVKKGGQL